MSKAEGGPRLVLLPAGAAAGGAPFAQDRNDDTALVRALVDRHPQAPRVLWQRFAPMVYRILKRALGPGHELEDLAQEVFLCLFEKIPTLREPGALKAFVISVTVLTARHELRRRWIRRWVRPSGDLPAVDGRVVYPEAEADAREALIRFYRILDRVNATDRAAFVLRFLEGLDLVDVAAAMDLSLATIKRRLARVWSRVSLLVERDPVLREYLPGLAADEGVSGSGSVRRP
jgi:RNA polymerase sigma-70 factor (ECF subfamily)